jgi:hypothetical protein
MATLAVARPTSISFCLLIVALLFLVAVPVAAQRPANTLGYPDVSGEWKEGSNLVRITQTGGTFVATCTYGNISWRMTGAITREGIVTGRLVHTAGVSPSATGYAQDRRLTLSADGRVLDGQATFAGGSGGHPLTWKRSSPLPPVVSAPPPSPPSTPPPTSTPANASGAVRTREFHDVCDDCGHKRIDLGEHDFCALTGFVVGGFNSRCDVGRTGSRWYLDITDPGPPDPWQGESQECKATCFTIAR